MHSGQWCSLVSARLKLCQQTQPSVCMQFVPQSLHYSYHPILWDRFRPPSYKSKQKGKQQSMDARTLRVYMDLECVSIDVKRKVWAFAKRTEAKRFQDIVEDDIKLISRLPPSVVGNLRWEILGPTLAKHPPFSQMFACVHRYVTGCHSPRGCKRIRYWERL